MLQRARVSRVVDDIEQLKPDFNSMQNLRRIRAEVNRLVAARYLIFIMSGVLLLSLAAQAFLFDGGVAMSRVFKVALVAVLGPGLVWAASDKEVRLLRELENRNRQLEQRVRENKALNRMTQAHLADCLSSSPKHHPAPGLPNQLPATKEVIVEAAPLSVRPDFKNVIALDPEDDESDRQYLEAASLPNIYG